MSDEAQPEEVVEAPAAPEAVTAFVATMTLDGLVVVTVDVPGKELLRQATHTDIQMMASFIRDSLVHPKPQQPSAEVSEKDPSEAVLKRLIERLSEKSEG